ncbi:hypothetical protein PHPALM_29903, partial [Phytophthora palmivora]
MNANNKPCAISSTPGLFVETSATSAKFDQKVVDAISASNQDGDDSLNKEEAKKEALKKQFIASQAMT